MGFFKGRETYDYILKIAIPAIAGLSTQMVVSLIDTAMVGRIPHAEFALAAMGLGVLSTWAVVSFFSSLATGTHIVVSRRFGENDDEHCGIALTTSGIISVGIGVVISLLIITFAYTIGDLFAADDLVGELTGDYLTYRFLGLPFFLLSVSYRGFYFGIRNTKVFMYGGIVASFLNIVLNYIFIFGAFSIPAMGLAGAGLASSIATVADASVQAVYSSRKSYRRKFLFFKRPFFSADIAKTVYKLSAPVSIQNIFILVGFLSFIAIIGLIGTFEQAASQVVITCLFLSIMPCYGFGIAAQTLVGNNLGSGNIQRAKYYAYETTKVATLYTIFIAILFISIPEYVLMIITDQKDLIKTAVPIMQLAGGAQIFYGIGLVLANGLQAAGKTIFVMAAEVTINWILFIPLAYLLGITFGYGLLGAWMAMPIYILLYSVVIGLKFNFGNWKNVKRV